MAPPPRSNAPVLLTIGFALGLSFAWMCFKPAPAKLPPPPLAPIPETSSALRRDAGTLKEVEGLFQRWGGYAVWENNITEVALWSMQDQKHDDYYEVRRSDGIFYFRSLRRLTRPVIDHGSRGRRPIEFTETQALHDSFHREHPDYDPTAEPVVDLPPSLPERYERTDLSNPPPAPSLTPGA